MQVLFHYVILNDKNVLNTTIIGRRKKCKHVDCVVRLKYNMYIVFFGRRGVKLCGRNSKSFSSDGIYCYDIIIFRRSPYSSAYICICI